MLLFVVCCGLRLICCVVICAVVCCCFLLFADVCVCLLLALRVVAVRCGLLCVDVM